MKCKYWLLLSLAPVAAALPAACSPAFSSCDTRGSCPQGGSGGKAGSGDTPDAGSATDAGSQGMAGSAGAGLGGAGGESGASGGEGGEPDDFPALFDACSVKGESACVGHASARRLACDGKHWQAGTTCGPDERCDSSTGMCATTVIECASATPGAVVCRKDTVLTCGPDLVTASEGETCEGLCKLGVCQAPKCGDEKIEKGEDCDDLAAATSGACLNCKTATCGDGVVFLDHEQCDDKNKISGDGCSATCRIEPVALALAGATTCALSSTGLVKCWGSNESGVLGLGDTASRGDVKSQVPSQLRAVDLGTNRRATAISVSEGNSACALLDGGDVKCWGNNAFGQLGTGSRDNRGDGPAEMGDALKPIPLGHRALAVSAGSNYTCVVLEEGSVKCWGSNAHGQLGDESAYTRDLSPELTPIDLKSKAKAISANDGITCALLEDGSAKCWGSTANLPYPAEADLDGSDSIGDFKGEISKLTALKFGNRRVQSIVAGPVSEAILDDGSLMLWGFGYQGWVNAGRSMEEFAVLPAMNMGLGKTGSARRACPIS